MLMLVLCGPTVPPGDPNLHIQHNKGIKSAAQYVSFVVVDAFLLIFIMTTEI